jgi:uncharacterized protein
VTETLSASGQLTELGDVFVAGMMRTLQSWAGDSVPVNAAKLARRLAEEHRARWNRSNG